MQSLTMYQVMKALQQRRQGSQVFAGRHGFITPRDLFRWAERRAVTNNALAEEGYCILAERLRKDEEKELVKEVLERVFKVTIDLDRLYSLDPSDPVFSTMSAKLVAHPSGGLQGVSWTKSMLRLFALVGKCLQRKVTHLFNVSSSFSPISWIPGACSAGW